MKRYFMLIASIVVIVIVGSLLGYFYYQKNLSLPERNVEPVSKEITEHDEASDQSNNENTATEDQEAINQTEEQTTDNTEDETEEAQREVPEEKEVRHFIMDDVTKEAFQLIEEENIDEAIEMLEAHANEEQSADRYAWLAAAYGKKIDSTDNVAKIMGLNSKMSNALNKAFEIDPDSLEATFVRGNKLLNTPSFFGGDTNKALSDFQTCLDQGIASEELFLAVADAYAKLGDTVKEDEYRQKAADLSNVSLRSPMAN
ncbi:tetratricopeptide repeat protein [Metabacillus malikii]|uniref:Tetratricopeptide (TPR) repeat protein n=1 Tax=Metabacillus malikii TaxID=1504265 RepID=A0ABT9ZB70_9BACI|nr:hypothetical protein [Metabacillus malikii]MDQ0229071.1 tetratricopeptide (TPR) repeat protein [Metabacillus malikii]